MGVTVIVATIGVALVLMAVNVGISPVPLAARPIPGVSFVQVKVLPVPLKLISVVGCPLGIA